MFGWDVMLAETGRSCATSKGGDKSQAVSLSGVVDHRRPGHETATSFKVHTHVNTHTHTVKVQLSAQFRMTPTIKRNKLQREDE